MPSPVSRASVSCDGLPVVDTPVHAPRRQQHDAQSLVARNAARLVVEPPAEDLPHMFLDQIALHGLRRLIEDLAVANRAAQLDVFRMRPHQRTSRAGGLAAKKFQRRNVGRIPDLFGKQTALSRSGILHHGQQRLGLIAMSGGESVVRALSGQQGPGAADAGAIKGGAVFVLAIAVAVVAIPARSLRQFDASRASMARSVFRIRGSSGARSPKRTSASASGLMM